MTTFVANVPGEDIYVATSNLSEPDIMLAVTGFVRSIVVWAARTFLKDNTFARLAQLIRGKSVTELYHYIAEMREFARNMVDMVRITSVTH